MKLFKWMKDGGPESKVSGFFLIEAKCWFTVALLKFDDGSRDAYHSHAFNSVSWVLTGALLEDHKHFQAEVHLPSIKPVITKRDTFHTVTSVGTTWVLTFRGPWIDRWKEYLPSSGTSLVLTHGRKVVT